MEELIRTVKKNKANNQKFVSIPKESSIQEGHEVVVTPKNSEKNFFEKMIRELVKAGYMEKNLNNEEIEACLTMVQPKKKKRK